MRGVLELAHPPMGRECFISFMVAIAEPRVMLTITMGALVVPRVQAKSPGVAFAGPHPDARCGLSASAHYTEAT